MYLGKMFYFLNKNCRCCCATKCRLFYSLFYKQKKKRIVVCTHKRAEKSVRAETRISRKEKLRNVHSTLDSSNRHVTFKKNLNYRKYDISRSIYPEKALKETVEKFFNSYLRLLVRLLLTKVIGYSTAHRNAIYSGVGGCV